MQQPNPSFPLVLVVEDDALVRAMAVDALEEGFAVLPGGGAPTRQENDGGQAELHRVALPVPGALP
jgi:CheY-like chemotaxis protein